MFTSKFNNTLVLLVILFFSFVLFAERQKALELLRERLETEKKSVSYRLQVVSEEENTILLRILNLKIRMMKLRALTDSNDWLKMQCPPWKEHCFRGYGMGSVYFKKDQRDIVQHIANAEMRLKRVESEKKYLEIRVADLKKGLVVDSKKTVSFRTTIPQLQGLFNCSRLRGWNQYRGVFLDVTEALSLPLDGVVDSVVSIAGKKMLTIDTGLFFISFAYVDTVFVKQGEQISAKTKLFDGAKGNPLKKDEVLLFIVKNDKFVSAQFVCK